MEPRLFNKRIVEPEFGIVQFLNEIQDYESECSRANSRESRIRNLGQTGEARFTQM